MNSNKSVTNYYYGVTVQNLSIDDALWRERGAKVRKSVAKAPVGLVNIYCAGLV